VEVNRFEVKNTIRGESAADLQFGNTAIALPASIITSTAIGYAEEMAQEYYTRIDFKQQVHEIKQRWNSKQLKQAMDSPALACESIGRINVKLDKSQAELHLYTPLLSSDVKINARVVDFFARLQFESETNTLTVLDDPRASVSETEQTFKKTKKTLEDHDDGRMKELLFLIRCDSDPQVFKEKLPSP